MRLSVVYCAVFFLLLFTGLSCAFELRWNLQHNGQQLLSGSADIITTDQSDEDDVANCLSCVQCSGLAHVHYSTSTVARLCLTRNQENLNLPELFTLLVGKGRSEHRYIYLTRHVFRDRLWPAPFACMYTLGWLFCCCCLCANRIFNWDGANDRVEDLRNSEARPWSYPYTVAMRQLSVSRVSADQTSPVMPQYKTVDVNTLIFDLFVATNQTQRWLSDHLRFRSNPVDLHDNMIVIPGLFDTPVQAHITSSIPAPDNSANAPTHILHLNMMSSLSLTVSYHLRRSSTGHYQVLAIILNHQGYTLTFHQNNYDPSPQLLFNVEETAGCNCNGACNCAGFTGERGNTSPSGSTPEITILLPGADSQF